MKRTVASVFAIACSISSCFADDAASHRSKAISLLDGKTLNGWQTEDGKPITKGWVVTDNGYLHRQTRGGHIYYEHEVGDFEFSFEWKLPARGNSGIKYRVRKYGGRTLGCEYQIYDDRGRPQSNSSTGSLYALYEPNKQKVVKPVGEWNSSKIVVAGTRIEHWLNDKKIVQAEVGSDDWKARVKKSKFAPYQQFSENRVGRLMIQDHGSTVWFRNLSLVRLNDSPTDGADKPVKDETAAAAKNVRQIIAHRGASLERPECTLAAINRAIDVKATAVEMDVRTSKDGVLFLLHDTTLDRTTNGSGKAADQTLAELKKLDAGSWFNAKYKSERIPTLAEGLKACRGKVDALLDLKEQGDAYDQKVAAAVKQHGDPARTIVGVRSVEQAKRFRKLLPKARQIGLIPNQAAIEAFAQAGVETIRLWPKWLTMADGKKLVSRVKAAKAQLHLNGTTGQADEVAALLKWRPFSMSSDDPRQLIQTLRAYE